MLYLFAGNLKFRLYTAAHLKKLIDMRGYQWRGAVCVRFVLWFTLMIFQVVQYAVQIVPGIDDVLVSPGSDKKIDSETHYANP